MANFIVAGVNTFLLPLGGTFHAELLWEPLTIGALLVGGQSMQFLALDRGDVSVAVPVFGLKVVLVAFFTTLIIHEPVAWELWVAAVLSVAAVVCLNRRDTDKPSRNIGITLLAGGAGSVCFALFDVLMQKWTRDWSGPDGASGAGRMIPLVFYSGAVLSFALIPFFKEPLSGIPRSAWPWLSSGSVLLGTQSALFICSFAVFGAATRANVLYNSRGLFSVLAVWFIGHWFANDEKNVGARIIRWRFAGALLMLAAIALVVGHKK